ncbi:zinc-binding metallopeptidase family protein [Gemmata sp.]|uniref:zinc-binding metallopeptidase family protein n=1 Tax=Gemmata sp. TaxID=1914242 RepID=UPI003F6EFECA
MKVFHCDHCDNLIFFENSVCVRCAHTLAYLPDLGVNGSLDKGKDRLWRSPLPRAGDRTYRLCENYTAHDVCNWAVPANDPNPFCLSCRLNKVIPNLTKPINRTAWYKMEVAKRRLVYSLVALRLPVVSKADDPAAGLAFEFLEDPADPKAPRVLTGHDNGLITMNISEADDAERERRRHQMHEKYRTLLGHFRHEIGHYYWDRLIKDSALLDGFRAVFGDEQADYGEALKRHYKDGPPAAWRDSYISTYATSHAWEDWAETWAHYLHMTDLLETTVDAGLTLRPKRPGHLAMTPSPSLVSITSSAFDAMIESWYALTYVLNNLNRGMGHPDGYPFVLSAPVVEKLRFVHEVIARHAAAPAHA